MNCTMVRALRFAPIVVLVTLLIFSDFSPIQREGSSQQNEFQLMTFDAPKEAQEHYLRKRVPVGETAIPVERYLALKEQIKKMPLYSTATNTFASAQSQSGLGTWTPLGPGNIGGRTRSLLIKPSDPNIMLAGGVAGGVWKTTDGGASWKPKGDLLPNLAISCMARGSDNTVYAGTGEGFATDGVSGAGIYMSTDWGENWVPLAGTQNNVNFLVINKIVVSPSDPKKIYVATNSALWLNTNMNKGGKWKQVLPISGSATCYDLAIRTDQTADHIFAMLAGASSGIYRSTSGGGQGTWSLVHNIQDFSRVSLAIAPSNQNYIYALTADGIGRLKYVLRSTSGGGSGSWTPVVTGATGQDPFFAYNLKEVILSNPITTLDCFLPRNPIHLGDYANVITVDPVNPNRVWAGGVDLFRSDDGGTNWGMASHWFAQPGTPPYVHADQHVIVFHPQYNGTSNKTLFAANDGGIFRTDNALAATSQDACNPSSPQFTWVSLNNGYGVTQFYHGLPYPDGTTYFGGTQDNGTLQGTDASGPNAWGRILGGDGGYVAIDPSATVSYAEGQFGTINRFISGGVTYIAATVRDGDFTVVNGQMVKTLPFITVFVLDPNNHHRMWTGGGYIWRTDNADDENDVDDPPIEGYDVVWTRSSTLLSGTITAIAVAPQNPNKVLVGTSDGKIYRNSSALSATPTTAWDFATLIPGPQISWIAFDPSNPQVVYATVSNFGGNHIFKSSDGGTSWSAVPFQVNGANLDIPVHCIVVDPSNSSRLYIGTDLGVFVSVDGGSTWARENTGFANATTESLAFTTYNGATTLYAFTHGRGAWRVSAGSSGNLPPTAPDNLNATAVSSSRIDLDWRDNSSEDGFRIERKKDGESQFTQIASVGANQTSYSDTSGLLPSTLYYYRVKAHKTGSPDSGYSNEAAATTLSSGTPPNAPGNLTAMAISSSQINLNWLDNSSNENGFRIERRRADEQNFVQIAERGPNTISYSDSNGLQPSTQYFYRVKAYITTIGESSYSNIANATTLSGPPPPPCSQVTTLSGTGSAGYVEGPSAQWSSPRAGVVAKYPGSGHKALFIADTDNHRIRVLYLEGPKAGSSELIAGSGTAGHKGGSNPLTVRYNSPTGITAITDANGVALALIIADTNNHMIKKLSAPPPSSVSWIPSNLGGQAGLPGSTNGNSSVSTFNFPLGVTAVPDGFIYVTDTDNNLIRKLDQQGNTTTLLNTKTAGMKSPAGITASQTTGNLYVCDTTGHSVWQVTTAGVASKIAGSGNSGFQDGTGTSALFNKPYHLIWHDNGGEVLYIADRSNHRIRKLTLSTNAVTTCAGSGIAGWFDSNCTMARFNTPRGVAVAATGEVYIIDTQNHRIRRAQ